MAVPPRPVVVVMRALQRRLRMLADAPMPPESNLLELTTGMAVTQVVAAVAELAQHQMPFLETYVLSGLLDRRWDGFVTDRRQSRPGVWVKGPGDGTHAIRRGHLGIRIDDDPAKCSTRPHSDRSDQLTTRVGSDGLAHSPGGTPGDDDNERRPGRLEAKSPG